MKRESFLERLVRERAVDVGYRSDRSICFARELLRPRIFGEKSVELSGFFHQLYADYFQIMRNRELPMLASQPDKTSRLFAQVGSIGERRADRGGSAGIGRGGFASSHLKKISEEI